MAFRSVETKDSLRNPGRDRSGDLMHPIPSARPHPALQHVGDRCSSCPRPVLVGLSASIF